MNNPKFYQDPQLFKHTAIMFLFGISAGIPILLIFSSLGIWMREAGIDRGTVTMFSWAALGYSFKFIWAPLIDRLPVPFMTNFFGRRRTWLLISQFSIIIAIFWLANHNPADPTTLTTMALAAVLLGFSSATQDIVIDAYRIESAPKNFQAIMSSSYIAGYRIGMLIAGAGALALASYFGSTKETYDYVAWFKTYNFMAMAMLIGVVTTLFIAEPAITKLKKDEFTGVDYLRISLIFIFSVMGLIGVYWYTGDISSYLKTTLGEVFANKGLARFLVETFRLSLGLGTAILIAIFATKLGVAKKRMVDETYIAPVKDFFTRYGVKISLLVLSLVGLYRISDIVLGIMANVFYQDLGFTKIQIATIVKSFGLTMTISGGFLGGIIAVRYGVMRTLLLGAILTVVTNSLFIVLDQIGANIPMLYVVISADNLTAGIATAAFIAFLSRLTNIEFTATQYAIFSSLMTLIPKIIGGYSGAIVDNVGYSSFFLFASILGVPIIFLVILVKNKLSNT